MKHNFSNGGLQTLVNIADEMEERIKNNDMSREYALSIKNCIEAYALPTINGIYGVIPDGCDEENQPYSSHYIESKYTSGVPLTNAEIAYIKLHRVSRALARFAGAYKPAKSMSSRDFVLGGNNE